MTQDEMFDLITDVGGLSSDTTIEELALVVGRNLYTSKDRMEFVRELLDNWD